MKIASWRGEQNYEKVLKDSKKKVFCEECGEVCIRKVVVMNQGYHSNTGKRWRTFRIVTRCPNRPYFSIFYNGHTDSEKDDSWNWD